MMCGRITLAAFVAILTLTACGGGGDDPVGPGPVRDSSPGGIWRGTTSEGTDLLGLVTEDGEFHFISLDEGVQYFGDVSTSEDEVTGEFTGVAPFDTTFEDGSTSGTGTITGTVDERLTLSGTSEFTTSEGTDIEQTFDLDYDELYERNSSLPRASGNYEQVGTGDVVNVNANGELFLQNTDSGCVINGNVEIIDSRFNAYHIEYTYDDCQGDFTALNGKTFRGLATLDNTVSPERMIVAATSSVGSNGISVVYVFERT